jgi:hypothetical protein
MKLGDSFTLVFGIFHILLVIMNPWVVNKSIIAPMIHVLIIFILGIATIASVFFKNQVLRKTLGIIYCVSAVMEILNLITWNIQGGDHYNLHLFLAFLDLIQATILFS